MGFACDSQYGQPTALQYLVNTHQIANAFSLCLDQSGQGGLFMLGGADSSTYTGQFQYTPFIGGLDELYNIWMTDIQVQGQSVQLDPNVLNGGGSTVVDTGTNILLLPDQPYQALRQVYSNLCGSLKLPGFCNVANKSATLFDGVCYPLTAAERASWPDLVLVFQGGLSVPMKANTYIIENVPGSGQYCLGITDTGSDGFTIIGDTTMAGYVTLFDRDNAQLGFAPVNAANCKAH